MKRILHTLGFVFALVLALACKQQEKIAQPGHASGSASVADSCQGPRIQDCITTKEYNPVCGCNGKTYPNRGEAACDGIRRYTQGPCTQK
jgi:hypothetical protein